MIAPKIVYSTPPLSEVRDLLFFDPEFLDASSETVAERLGLEAWLVEMALEALATEGEVLA
jgi:hypothetical protein